MKSIAVTDETTTSVHGGRKYYMEFKALIVRLLIGRFCKVFFHIYNLSTVSCQNYEVKMLLNESAISVSSSLFHC